MKTILVLSCFLLLAAGCRNGSDRADTVADQQTTEATAASTSQPDTSPASEAALKPALLTLSDFPTGWSTWSSTNSGDDSTCGINVRRIAAPKALAEASFSKSQLGPFLFQLVATYDNVGAAVAWQELVDKMSRCPGYTAKDGTVWTFKPLSFPKLEDETFTLRASAGPSILGVTEIDYVFVKRKSVILLVAQISVGFSGIDSAFTEQMARKADARLRALLP